MKTKEPTPVKKNICYFIRVWRAQNGLTQQQAAEFFGCGRNYVTLIERGTTPPQGALAKRISDLTGAPLELVIGAVSEAK